MLNVVDSEWPILICVFIRCWRQHIICCAKFSIPMVAGGHTAALYLRLTSALFREKQRQMLLFERFGIFRTKWIMILEKIPCVSIAEWPAALSCRRRASAGLVCINFIGVCCQAQKFVYLFFPIHYIPPSVQGNRWRPWTCFSFKWPVANRKRRYQN